MHTTHSNTQYKNECSTVKWAQWDKTQSRELLVCSYVCALHCAQLLHTILHETDLIIFPLTLQTTTIAPMISTWRKGAKLVKSRPLTQLCTRSTTWHQINCQRSMYQQKWLLLPTALHCVQRKPLVFSLLRGWFWGFSPHRGDTLHRWGEIWHGASSVPNFTPIGATTRA